MACFAVCRLGLAGEFRWPEIVALSRAPLGGMACGVRAKPAVEQPPMLVSVYPVAFAWHPSPRFHACCIRPPCRHGPDPAYCPSLTIRHAPAGPRTTTWGHPTTGWQFSTLDNCVYREQKDGPPGTRSGSSPMAVETPRERVPRGAFSANTERAVRADLGVFAAWCGECGKAPMPAGPETIAAFVDAMVGDARAGDRAALRGQHRVGAPERGPGQGRAQRPRQARAQAHAPAQGPPPGAGARPDLAAAGAPDRGVGGPGDRRPEPGAGGRGVRRDAQAIGTVRTASQ